MDVLRRRKESSVVGGAGFWTRGMGGGAAGNCLKHKFIFWAEKSLLPWEEHGEQRA